MIALDTNVLIRLIIFDDPMQSGVADDLIRNNRIFISKGVLMESEWVLRYRYKFRREQLIRRADAAGDPPNEAFSSGGTRPWFRLMGLRGYGVTGLCGE